MLDFLHDELRVRLTEERNTFLRRLGVNGDRPMLDQRFAYAVPDSDVWVRWSLGLQGGENGPEWVHLFELTEKNNSTLLVTAVGLRGTIVRATEAVTLGAYDGKDRRFRAEQLFSLEAVIKSDSLKRVRAVLRYALQRLSGAAE